MTRTEIDNLIREIIATSTDQEMEAQVDQILDSIEFDTLATNNGYIQPIEYLC
jgi:hypothetical protein